MWNIDKIKIRNFRLFIDEDYKFSQDTAVMIFGKHKNGEFANSNGTGKSSFLKAIEFALLGITSRVLPKEEYIHNGEKECHVTLWLSNPALKKEMIIKRSLFRSKSKPAKAIVFINGSENTELINELEVNQFIENTLKITREDLLNYFLVGQSNQMSFLRTTDSRQKEIIARFANADALDIVLSEIKSHSSSIESDLAILRSNNRKIEGRMELLYEQIQNHKGKEGDNVSKLKEELNNFESQMRAKIARHYERKTELREQLLEREQEMKSIEKEIKNQDNNIQEKIAALSTEIKLLKRDLDHMKQELEGEIECPNCQHKFLLDGTHTIEELQQLVSESDLLLQQKRVELNTLEQKEEEQRIKTRKLKSLKHGVESLRSDLELIDEMIESAENRILLKQENFIKVQKESSNPVEDMVNNWQRERKEQEDIFEKNNSKIAKLEQQLDEYKFWNVNFGLRGFKTFLINRMLDLLQANINFYLAKISTFQVRMEGYKVLADGSIRDKITVLVSKDGDKWEHYEKFSGGQQNRIDICTVLALRRIINQNAVANSGGLNFLGLDEAFDGLDNIGQKFVIDALDGIGETCMIVSHNNDNIAFKNKLIILSDKGTSRIT